MKTRNGFVSNSSSTSFVVWLPKGFDLSCVNIDEQVEVDYYVTKEQIEKALNALISGKTISEYDGVGVYYACSEILKDFVLATLSTSSDAGEIIAVSTLRMKKVKSKFESMKSATKNGPIMEF